MKTNEKLSLMRDLQENPQSVATLLSKTGGNNKKLMSFLQWIYNFHIWSRPLLLQGDDDMADEYQGQPVVWDGAFDLNDNGDIVYSGWAGASGMGDEVERVVKTTDLVMVG